MVQLRRPAAGEDLVVRAVPLGQLQAQDLTGARLLADDDNGRLGSGGFTPHGEGWLDIQHGAVTVCKDDPGYDVDLAITADTGQMQRWLVGLVPFRDLIANGYARLLGPSRLARAFPAWFDTTYFAEALHRAEQRHGRQAIPGQGQTA
jgi:hypothetical protein